MGSSSDGVTHLQGVTLEIAYPAGPFYPAVPVHARFSGVLTAEGQLHVKLDTGSIPGNPTAAGVAVRGTFAVGPDETLMSFSGILSDNRIRASTRVGRSRF